MKNLSTKKLIAVVILALSPFGILGVIQGSGEIIAGFFVVASLAFLGGLELRNGAAKQRLGRKVKYSTELYSRVKSEI